MKKQKPTVKKIEIERGLQERIEPEIGAFPLQFLRQEFSPHTYQVIDWHWHAGPQFCSVIRGNFHFRVLNRTLYLQEGDGIFINAQQVHTARPEKDSGQYLCLNLPLHLLGPEGSELFECCTARTVSFCRSGSRLPPFRSFFGRDSAPPQTLLPPG